MVQWRVERINRDQWRYHWRGTHQWCSRARPYYFDRKKPYPGLALSNFSGLGPIQGLLFPSGPALSWPLKGISTEHFPWLVTTWFWTWTQIKIEWFEYFISRCTNVFGIFRWVFFRHLCRALYWFKKPYPGPFLALKEPGRPGPGTLYITAISQY